MKIIIAGEIDFSPEVRNAVLTGAQNLIALALQEKGCRHYTWTPDFYQPGRVHVFEEWDCEEDLAAHFAGVPYLNMVAHLNAYTMVDAKTRKYSVALTDEVYTPDGVPSARFSAAAR